MDSTDNAQYSMLVNIAKEIGELRSDVKNVERKISNTDERLDEIDKTLTTRVSEAFDAMMKKQEFLRDGIEAEMNSIRGDVKALKSEIVTLESRIKAIEESPKTRLFAIFTQFKSLFITAILAALVGWCVSVSRDVAKSIKQQAISGSGIEIIQDTK